MEVAVTELLQPQGHTRHGAHEGGIHHGAILQIDDELAVAAVNHFLGELLQITAVQETSLTFHPYPNSWTVSAGT